MKRYRTYMDNIKATDDLRQRLRELETPVKRPVPWKKYGAMAAALVLMLGLAGYGVHYWDTVIDPRGQAFLDRTLAYGPEGVPVPDIAVEDPGETDQPGSKTLGGYEYHEYEGVTSYCILPYIEYGAVYGDPVALDWDIPQGAIRRNLPRDEIVALMGGEDVINTHLDWGGYELTGWAAWEWDGSFWGVYINGAERVYGTDSFEFAVTNGRLPPTCCVYPNSVSQEVRGLNVTADKFDWEMGQERLSAPERRVSFFKGDLGCRFVASSCNTEQSERLVSRLVCRIADEGLGVDLTDAYAEMRGSVCKTCGEEIVPGTRHFHGPIYICPDCGQAMQVDDMRAHVHSFNPETADSQYAAPPMSAPPVSVSAEPYVCTGYPTPDPAESWEISDSHPLAPEGWTGPSDSGAVTDPGLTGSGELCGLPLAPEGWNGP